MKITVLYNENNGCDYHRLLLPIQNLKLSGCDTISTVQHQHFFQFDHLADCDILMYSRLYNNDFDKLKELKRKHGFKVVVDFDDLNELYYSHHLYSSWKRHNIADKMIQNCSLADCITVTNEQLYEKYKQYNKNIEILPNSLPIGREPYVSHKEYSDKIRFLYVAGSSHYSDLNTISNLFKKLNSDGEFKKLSNFTLCGFDNDTDKQNVWNKMEAIVKSCGSYTRRYTLPLKEYIKHYNYGDVAIAPLQDNEFNRCKSNLKFVEAGTMRLPFICVDMLPYTIDKQLQNKGIKFCSKTSDWYDAFKFFIRNPNAIEDYGNINYEYVKENYNLENVNKKRFGILKSLI